MRRRPGGRLSLKEQRRQHQISTNYYAVAGGKAIPHPEAYQEPVKRAKRAARSADGKPLERQVLRAVTAALRHDPRVSRVERNQSGVFVEGDRHIRVGSRGKLDLTVYLRDGRYLELEVKRPGGKPDPRQAARIQDIRANGGLADFCWSVESALAVLP